MSQDSDVCSIYAFVIADNIHVQVYFCRYSSPSLIRLPYICQETVATLER